MINAEKFIQYAEGMPDTMAMFLDFVRNTTPNFYTDEVSPEFKRALGGRRMRTFPTIVSRTDGTYHVSQYQADIKDYVVTHYTNRADVIAVIEAAFRADAEAHNDELANSYEFASEEEEEEGTEMDENTDAIRKIAHEKFDGMDIEQAIIVAKALGYDEEDASWIEFGETVAESIDEARDFEVHNFTSKFLDFARLSGAQLERACLGAGRLSNANLRDANLRDANLRGADLRGANLQNANLQNASLRDANLRDANLRGADLKDADLVDADLRGADLRGADFRTNFTRRLVLTNATYNAATRWPEGFDPQAAGADAAGGEL